MDFEFSDTQRQLQAEVRRFLAEHCTSGMVRTVLDGAATYDIKLWQGMAALGLQASAIPEEYGGAGGDGLDLCVVAEELGRVLAPVPFASSIYLATPIILQAGTEAQKRHHLPALATGGTIACFALTEQPGDPAPGRIVATVSGDRLTGSKWPVLDGGAAGLAIVAARDEMHDGAISLFLVTLDGPGVSRTTLPCIDPTRSQAGLHFSAAPVKRLGPPGEGWRLATEALDRAAVFTAFEQVGGAEQALYAARDYALERQAFGRSIGSFQAIKHKLADMYVATVLARSNAYFGAWAVANDPGALPRAASACRISATQAFQLCAKENIQVHGGMGFTWEADCHLFYRRAQLLALSLGGLSYWHKRLAGCLRDGYLAQEAAA